MQGLGGRYLIGRYKMEGYIIPERLYYVTDECAARVDGKRTFMRMSGDDIEKSKAEYSVDRRLPLVSFKGNGVDKITAYLNYLKLLSIISCFLEASRSDITNRFVNLLDLGYIPLIMPPSFFEKTVHEVLKPQIEKSGIRFIYHKALRTDGSRLDMSTDDIWGSRMDISNLLGVKYTEVNPLKFFLGVIK
jgi:hypothetical protein